MMQGKRETFEYFECGSCGCLQITAIPPDMSPYYGEGYYSVRVRNPARQYLKEQRAIFLGTGKGWVGRAMSWLKPRCNPEGVVPEGVAKSDRILDVGCGSGDFLWRMFEFGYSKLWGIDPYMDSRYIRASPIRLERKSIFDFDSGGVQFDVIIFVHSFEHIAQQQATLARARELLTEDGVCILRIPFASSYAWEHYRTDWVNLDAPRHFFLHTSRSLNILAESAGFRVRRCDYDSNASQFWGSEQYRRDIPLMDARSWMVSPAKSIFTKEEILDFQRRAEILNRERRGDQVAAYLVKT